MLIQRVANRWLAGSTEVLAVGDLAVFKGSSTRHPFWRGSPKPVLNHGEYFTDDPQVALWYARNFSRDGYITGYSVGGKVLDATRRPRQAIEEASGVALDTQDPRQEYMEAWEVLENIKGVVEALSKKGFTSVKFHDVAPTRGVVAYKYIGGRTLKGNPTAKVVSRQDIQKYLPGISQRLWGNDKALPLTEKGWDAASEALNDLQSGWDVDDPEDYIGRGGFTLDWSDVERVL